MKGFFYDEKPSEYEQKSKKVKTYDCEDCKLYKKCKSPKMKPSGLGDLEILIVAEAPGKTEDEKGIQLIGESGQLLRNTLKSLGYDLDEDFWKTNAIICRPPDNRKPTVKEITSCRNNLLRCIKEKKPKKIIALGGVAIESLIGASGIEKWFGFSIPNQELGCWVYPTYHPAYLLRNKHDKLLSKMFKKSLSFAIDDERKFPDYSEIDNCVEIFNSPFQAIIFMQGIHDGSVIAIDIETTGKKPHAPGHEIICLSIATSVDTVKVFPIFDDEEFLRELRKLMKNEKIKKVAHNLKFENIWFRIILKILIKGWYWDTMIGVHIIDNRRKITGLKDQVFINYGIKGYDDEVSPYLKSKSKSSNAFNRVKECDPIKLMKYCAFDSLFALWLQRDQQRIMTKNDRMAYDFFHTGVLEFCQIEQRGICIDSDFYSKKIEMITNKMNHLDKKIMKSDEVKKWDTKKPFKHTSSKDLTHLLFDILGVESDSRTKNGNMSVDQEALEGIEGCPFVDDIVKWRKWDKIKNTFIAGFMRESHNGKIYPGFHLNTTVTYRPSSSDPNFANIPKHDKRAKKYTRSGIVPSEGRQLVEVDYSGIEVRISACYHKDPAMIKYINDPTTDMHRDQAMELFIMDQKQVTKDLRYLAKNNFVFAEFYGDWWKSCAESLWYKIDEDTKQWLRDQGIKGMGKLIKRNNRIVDATGFYKHVMEVEDKFWNEKFRVYNQWKKDTWEQYQKKGYIETLTNFTLRKKMDRNDALNYPIQGSAFHCLLLSMIYLNKYLKKKKYETEIVGQIYDSIVFDMVPDEKEELKPIIRKIMTEKIKKKFGWIIVPLDIEMEVSDINGNWHEMKEEEI